MTSPTAAALALRNVVDDIIADEKVQAVEVEDTPGAWEMVAVADLTIGRTVWRSTKAQWQRVTNIVPGASLHLLVFGEDDDYLAVSPNAAVRAERVEVEAQAS